MLQREAAQLQKHLEDQKAELVRQQASVAAKLAEADADVKERQEKSSLHETKIQQRVASLKKQEEILVR